MLPLKMKQSQMESKSSSLSSNELDDYVRRAQACHARFEQVRSQLGLIIRIKGRGGGFVPVLASLGIQAKNLHLGKISKEKKDAFVHVYSASPVLLCLGGSLLTSSAFNTSNNRYHYNCFSFTSQSRLIVNQPRVHAMSIPAKVCHF